MTGPELRAVRQKLKLTQRGMADRLGVSWNTVARWERGEQRIPEPVARLARFLRPHHRMPLEERRKRRWVRRLMRVIEHEAGQR